LSQSNKKKDVHFHVHTVKGSALQIGGVRVGAAAAKMELVLEKCDDDDLSSAKPALEELETAYTEFVASLRAFLEE
jgi:hypothetical protein